MIIKTPLAWKKWDLALDRFGEWILLTSIATMSLPPIIGSIVLFLAAWFFMEKSERELPPDIKRYSQLRKKRKKQHLGKEEEFELSTYEAANVFDPIERNNRLYWIGCSVFMIAFLYHSFQLIPFKKLFDLFFGLAL